MPRPKKDIVEKSGKERIKEAFWMLYTEKPIEQIGIKEIAALAGCNRTTFYYHYDNINAVLDEIESDVVLKDGPQLFMNIINTEGNLDELMEYVKANEAKIKIICHLLSSKGDPMFLHKMKSAMMEEWRKLLFPMDDHLPKDMHIMLEYFMGGSLSLMGSLMDSPEYTLEEVLEVLMHMLSTDVFLAIKHILLQSAGL